MVVVSLYCFYLDCLVLSGNLREEESRIHPERVCTRFFTLFRMTVLMLHQFYFTFIPKRIARLSLPPSSVLNLIVVDAVISLSVNVL